MTVQQPADSKVLKPERWDLKNAEKSRRDDGTFSHVQDIVKGY